MRRGRGFLPFEYIIDCSCNEKDKRVISELVENGIIAEENSVPFMFRDSSRILHNLPSPNLKAILTFRPKILLPHSPSQPHYPSLWGGVSDHGSSWEA